MPRGNIGEKSDHKRERLGEHPNHFHRNHNRCQPYRYPWGGKDMLPIVTIPTKGSDKKSKQGQCPCKYNIIGEGTWDNRHQPQKVSHQNQKEDCKQIRHIALVLSVAYIRTGYVIANKDNEHFQKIGQALRGFRVFLIRTRYRSKGKHHKQCYKEK